MTAMQRIFRRHFNKGRHRTIPDRNIIKNWVQKFRTTASATNKNLGGTFRTEILRAAIGRSPKRSVRRHSVVLNDSSRSLQRILRSDVHFHPYKLQTIQELSGCNFASKSSFYEQFVTLVKEHLDVIRHLIMSDGSHLELSGCVNIKNVWYWNEDIRMKCMWNHLQHGL